MQSELATELRNCNLSFARRNRKLVWRCSSVAIVCVPGQVSCGRKGKLATALPEDIEVRVCPIAE